MKIKEKVCYGFCDIWDRTMSLVEIVLIGLFFVGGIFPALYKKIKNCKHANAIGVLAFLASVLVLITLKVIAENTTSDLIYSFCSIVGGLGSLLVIVFSFSFFEFLWTQ